MKNCQTGISKCPKKPQQIDLKKLGIIQIIQYSPSLKEDLPILSE